MGYIRATIVYVKVQLNAYLWYVTTIDMDKKTYRSLIVTFPQLDKDCIIYYEYFLRK
jgi:hypothetical protein